MEPLSIYHDALPGFLAPLCATPEMRRLKDVGMNCGCEYTSFPRFKGLESYSRWDHSLGVALIVWRFTRDRAQALSGLLHDVATPVFAHVVDFMRGDYLTQEATEDGTEAMIAGDGELQAILAECGLTTADVWDYHRYPIADNDAPRLSADRLEYTLGNVINFGIGDLAAVRQFYDDLTVSAGEDGQDELAFRTPGIAGEFARAALQCARIYVSDEDRYAMQMLSELLKDAVERGVIDEADLHATEPETIGKLLTDGASAANWRNYRALFRMIAANEPRGTGPWRQIRAKKRRIDPLVAGQGRVSALDPAFGRALEAFMASPQDYWICGESLT